MKKPNRQVLREDAEEFVVLIAMKGPDGITYDSIGYADEETDINYEEGIYGYDTDVRENVHAMTRDAATKLAAEVIENAPAGDLLVGVVPYSTIPSEGSEGFSTKSSTEDFTDDGEGAEADEFDDSEVAEDEGSEEAEGSEEDESEDELEESIKKAMRFKAATIREEVLGFNRLREAKESSEEDDEIPNDIIESIASEVYDTYSEDMFTKLRSELGVEDVEGPEDEQDYEDLCADIKAWTKDESEIDLDEDPISIAEVYMLSLNFEGFAYDKLQYWMDVNESDGE